MKTHLVFAILTGLLLLFAINRKKERGIDFETIVAMAEDLATEAWRPQPQVQSRILRSLTYDQMRDIRFKEEHTLWRKRGLPFQVRFFHAGHIHPERINIFHVSKEGAGPVRFSPEFFDYGKNTIPPGDRAKGDYAGFRIHYPLNKPDVLDELCVFLGASYFRALGRNLQYGMSARGLAVNTSKDEEFPAFTSFWLMEPNRGAGSMTLYALLDGKSVTGAYSMVIHPGETTRMDIKAVLFFRKAPDTLGLAPLTSMFWYGENTSNTFGNFRPEVHDSDGLLLETEDGEWIWRPLSWSPNQQDNTFAADSVRGFGLLQRDRDFEHYQDLEAHYHMRPSVWVEPGGNWGKGSVRLIQLPAQNEYMDNVVAFWTPETMPKRGARMELSYSLHWYGDRPDRPRLARCISTRVDFQEEAYYRMMVLDFSGGGIESIAADDPPAANVTYTEPGSLSQIIVQRNEYDKSWRASFVVSSSKKGEPIELTCRLERDGKPISETWTYTWTP
jgi:glucans biosynthesis protein